MSLVIFILFLLFGCSVKSDVNQLDKNSANVYDMACKLAYVQREMLFTFSSEIPDEMQMFINSSEYKMILDKKGRELFGEAFETCKKASATTGFKRGYILSEGNIKIIQICCYFKFYECKNIDCVNVEMDKEFSVLEDLAERGENIWQKSLYKRRSKKDMITSSKIKSSAFRKTWVKKFKWGERHYIFAISSVKNEGYIAVVSALQKYYIKILKLNLQGNIIWEKNLKRRWRHECIRAITVSQDKSFIIAGDSLVLKFDPEVNLIWEKKFSMYIQAIIPAVDVGYIVTGITDQGYSKVFKLNDDGDNVWSRKFGGMFRAIASTSPKHYILSGYTRSKGMGLLDVWLIKIDLQGKIIWEKTFGGTDSDTLVAMASVDGGFYLGADTESEGAGEEDIWVLKVDYEGHLIWEKTIGGGAKDRPASIANTSDGGCIVVGFTYSKGSGGKDMWIVKLNAKGKILGEETLGGSGEDSSLTIIPALDGGYIVTGYITSEDGSEEAIIFKIE